MIGQTIRRYRIDRRIGEGGMGVVYAARDLELDRDVALKMIRAELTDPSLRERFLREARAAARINHPNIGHLYEVGEEAGHTFLAMELLEGETLADRIARKPLTPSETVRVGLELLDALRALHAQGFIHRDVKPSNVFLLADGRVKLLDFGLVLPVKTGDGKASPGLTMSGMVLGSPRYMSPEQIRGGPVDPRSDLFAVGALLYESLTGRPAFPGNDTVSVMYAVTNARVPELTGSAELAAIGLVLSRALAKHPEQRPARAEEMAAALRAAGETGSASRPGAPIERVVRLAVVPFRMLRPDPDLEFLGPSLADAIGMSLAGIRSLVVRSPMAAARFTGPAPDLAELARALDCDVVLFGTILTAGGRCRVAAQLVEAPGGEVLWSQTSEAAGGDVFEIQDQLVRKIVESLQLPLSARERRSLGSDVPGNPVAYEYFLRANRSAAIGNQLVVARELYERSLEADPRYAPAWVRLARCHRVLGKYGFGETAEQEFERCQEALARALELHPDMPSAHHVAAHFALDLGQVGDALDELTRVVERNPNDPQGWSGLVAAFRYVGMLEESVAAYRRAIQLEPGIVTSYFHTLDSLGRYEEALRQPDTTFEFDHIRILAMVGRDQEALERAANLKAREHGTRLELWMDIMEASVRRDAEQARRAGVRMEDFRDPEGLCVIARCRVHAGDVPGGMGMFTHAVELGYSNVPLFRNDPWLEPVRSQPAFQAALAVAEERHQAALAANRGRVLTLPVSAPAR
jgi:TolB-like protein/tetratricopeptide (TPR) repeat protein